MAQEFALEVLGRLPLAEAVLSLWRWVTDDLYLQELFDEHRGACYDKRIPFPVMVRIIADALLQHGGSGRKSFERNREERTLEASLQAAYAKLGRLPLALTEAFLKESTQRMLEVAPAPRQLEIPESLRGFAVRVVDGKIIKRVPKRLKPLRKIKGGVLGGKGLVAWDLGSGLALGMAVHPDGETNDAKLVPALLSQFREEPSTPAVLWMADRQFCDLNQTEEFTQRPNHHFVVRYHPKNGFYPDATQPTRSGQDVQGRAWTEEWGWLGHPRHRKRRYVRRITLVRPGEDTIILVTSLLDADRSPANDLLALYLCRWGIERVFQRITEIFHLESLIGTTPEGTLFQLAFCLLLYNQIQVVRGYIAVAQQRQPETISTELLFDDVRRQLVALSTVVEPPKIASLFATVPTAQAMRAKLTKLLQGVWTDRWIKAPSRKRRPPQKQSKRDHTSVYRILTACRKPRVKDTPSG
jgi:hypothetical protein